MFQDPKWSGPEEPNQPLILQECDDWTGMSDAADPFETDSDSEALFGVAGAIGLCAASRRRDSDEGDEDGYGDDYTDDEFDDDDEDLDDEDLDDDFDDDDVDDDVEDDFVEDDDV